MFGEFLQVEPHPPVERKRLVAVPMELAETRRVVQALPARPAVRTRHATTDKPPTPRTR